jgi:hypothetical protein
VRLGREPGWHDFCDPEGERAVFGEIAQLLEQRRIGHRRERGDGMDGDATLGWAAPALDGRDSAVVSDGPASTYWVGAVSCVS